MSKKQHVSEKVSGGCRHNVKGKGRSSGNPEDLVVALPPALSSLCSHLILKWKWEQRVWSLPPPLCD